MRLKAVLHYLGIFLIGLGLIMIVPLACSLLYREADTIPFITSIAITVGTGLLLWLLTRQKKFQLSRRDSLLLAASIWIMAAAFGALPYYFAGTFTSYIDAYFESISGFTTTGASVLTSIESQFHGILLWRDMTQWLGGMGIVMLFVAIFPLLGIGASHLVESELPGPKGERLTARIRDTAKVLWQIYLGLTLLEIIALLIAGLPLFDALANAFGTMPTGGFCPKDISIAAYNNLAVEIIIVIFMLAAGTNFQMYYYLLWKHQIRVLLADREFRVYTGILLGATVFLALDLILKMGYPAGEAIRYAVFQSVSIQTTTGFATADFALWPSFSQAILLILMVIGASAFSTGGALKVIRIIILMKFVYRQILLAFSPRTIRPLKVGDKIISERVASEVVGLSLLYVTALFIGYLIMSALGLDTITALSSVFATLGNIGPGLNAVGPMANYAFVPALGKIVLCVCMLVGRLELWTVLVLVTPAFWKER